MTSIYEKNTCVTCALLHDDVRPCYKCTCSPCKLPVCRCDDVRTSCWQPAGWFVELERLRRFLLEHGTCKTCGNGPVPKGGDLLCEGCSTCEGCTLGNKGWFPSDEVRAAMEAAEQ